LKKKKPRIVHTDGGAFIEPPNFKFHDAYYSVVDNKGELIHFEKNIGDFHSIVPEYQSIKWAVENILERPLTIYNDNKVAIGWARRGSSKNSSYLALPLNLDGIKLEYKKGTKADEWNAKNYSPKKDKSFYIKRYYALKERRVL